MKKITSYLSLLLLGLTLSITAACPGETPDGDKDGGTVVEETPDFELYKTTIINYKKCIAAKSIYGGYSKKFLKEFDPAYLEYYSNFTISGFKEFITSETLKLKNSEYVEIDAKPFNACLKDLQAKLENDQCPQLNSKTELCKEAIKPLSKVGEKCSGALDCSGDTTVCVENDQCKNVCQELGKEGDTCGSVFTKEGLINFGDCATELACQHMEDNVKGKCVKRMEDDTPDEETPLPKVGDTCNLAEDENCGGLNLGLFCGDGNKCEAIKLAGIGEECQKIFTENQSDICKNSLSENYCKLPENAAEGAKGICAKAATIGEVCTEMDRCALKDSFCVKQTDNTFKCEKFLNLGDSCSTVEGSAICDIVKGLECDSMTQKCISNFAPDYSDYMCMEKES